ncbi:MAG: mechanosensitive ion channel, partial [Hyphomicrobiaceae bacterium]|nr:mechanosensitive ion channel [Hyphomicrobiaceae bacterium]
GLAIGFGAQKLVQDVITGIFIQIENAINVGDVVTVAGTTGVVERLTIRSVGMRDLEGVYHIVPFSAVDTVSNFMRKFAYHVAEIGVAYKEDISKVREAMLDAFDRLKETEHGKSIIGEFEMHGVTALADSSVNVRGRIKTKPGDQWAVGRAYTEMVKKVFDERGIEIPYPHRTMVYQGGLPPEVSVSVAQMMKDSPKSGVDDTGQAPPKPRRSRARKVENDPHIPGTSEVDGD